MRTFVGLLTLAVAAAIAVLTVSSVISAGGVDILTLASVIVVALFVVAGIGALRND
ncbi:MAG: hypothetical protein WCL20_03160 [Actinomycetes bacterium]